MHALTTRIPIKDQHGNIVSEKEVATYAGLLAKAHEEGLCAITTRLLQPPAAENGEVAIVEATVTTSKGTFAGIGDAAPGNVNRRIVGHLIRMAETRAKARALRDAVNIGVVALEELGGDDDDVPANRAPAQAPAKVRPFPQREETPARRAPPAEAPRAPARDGRTAAGGAMLMTENQRRYLYRFLAERGFEGAAATDALCRAAEVQDVGQITKKVASELIDAWKQDGAHAA